MKTTSNPQVTLVSVITLFLCSTVLTFAQVPRIIAFQGQAEGVNGNPLNGSFTMTFRLYTVASNGVALGAKHTPTCK